MPNNPYFHQWIIQFLHLFNFPKEFDPNSLLSLSPEEKFQITPDLAVKYSTLVGYPALLFTSPRFLFHNPYGPTFINSAGKIEYFLRNIQYTELEYHLQLSRHSIP